MAIEEGTLYPLLRRLESQGLLASLLDGLLPVVALGSLAVGGYYLYNGSGSPSTHPGIANLIPAEKAQAEAKSQTKPPPPRQRSPTSAALRSTPNTVRFSPNVPGAGVSAPSSTPHHS